VANGASSDDLQLRLTNISKHFAKPKTQRLVQEKYRHLCKALTTEDQIRLHLQHGKEQNEMANRVQQARKVMGIQETVPEPVKLGQKRKGK